MDAGCRWRPRESYFKCADEALIDILAQRLHRGMLSRLIQVVHLLPSRKLVLSLLERRITDKKLLSHMMFVGEKGGAWANYAPDGALHIAFDTTLTVPIILKSAMTELVRTPLHRPHGNRRGKANDGERHQAERHQACRIPAAQARFVSARTTIPH